VDWCLKLCYTEGNEEDNRMNRIVVDPKIVHGQPVVRGTRVPVAVIVGSLAGGMTFEEVEAEYGVTRDDILACLDYAARSVNEERIPPNLLQPGRRIESVLKLHSHLGFIVGD